MGEGWGGWGTAGKTQAVGGRAVRSVARMAGGRPIWRDLLPDQGVCWDPQSERKTVCPFEAGKSQDQIQSGGVSLVAEGRVLGEERLEVQTTGGYYHRPGGKG